MNNIKTRAVKNKEIMLELVKQGFELLNVSIDNQTKKPCYIFENTDEFKVEFDKLILQRSCGGLTEFEKKFLIEMLCVKKYELQQSNLKADTVDDIIKKLSGSNDEVKKDNKENGELKIIRKRQDGYTYLVNDEISSKLIEQIKNNPVNLSDNLLNIKPDFDLIRRR